MNSSVVLEGVSKSHGNVLAVNQVSLTVGHGEFFSILGPSGSGKTTLLRLIAGLDLPDQGCIRIQHRDVTLDPPHLRPVNMVFQQYALFPHLTAYDNIAFGLRMKKYTASEIGHQVEEMVALVRLEGKEQRLPSELSGGEQQRVAMARALINRPVVVLLDEPMAALDQQLRQNMQMELKRWQQEVQATFVCVTHHQEDALKLSDRLAVMHQGKILQVGTPQDIYEQPASISVAEFIGTSNALTGYLVRFDERQCWVDHEAGSRVVANLNGNKINEGPIKLLIRPENLYVSSNASEKGYDNTLEAVLEQTGFNGNELWCHVRLRNQVLWVLRVPIQEARQIRFTIGDHVYLHWNASDGVVL